ncbi:MAG TPA: NAD-dependent epimerase/dehydratase family protein [Acidimicrobiales bacterium]
MIGGKRVLISGMGGELGSRVAQLLENESWVGAIEGLDIDPPRRRLRRAHFHRIEPRDRRRTYDVVARFDPHVVLHLALYEPNARANPRSAVERSEAAALGVLGAAAECSSLQQIVVRSGIEVYGRRRGAATRPDETVEPDPTTPFGRSLHHAELLAREAGLATRAPVTLLRFAPVVGPHVPSPLGRFLRLPLVPVSLLANPSFSLLHVEDAAHAVIVAAQKGYDGPLNVVASGAVTAEQAARFGGRIPLPLVGPQWPVARVVAGAAGAPVPEHVLELVHRGRTADAALAHRVLGFAPQASTPDVVKHLFQWAAVFHMRPNEEVA